MEKENGEEYKGEVGGNSSREKVMRKERKKERNDQKNIENMRRKIRK